MNTGTGTTSVTVNTGGTFNNSGALTVAGAGSVGTHMTGSDSLVNNAAGAIITGNTGIVVDNPTGLAVIINHGTIVGTGGVSVNALGSAGVTIGDFGRFTNPVRLGSGINTVIIGTQIRYTPIAGGAGSNDTLRLAGATSDTLRLTDFPGYEFLDKVGGGLWNLTGANPFSGGTTVSAGILNVQELPDQQHGRATRRHPHRSRPDRRESHQFRLRHARHPLRHHQSSDRPRDALRKGELYAKSRRRAGHPGER